MNYRIRINFKDDEKRIISADCYENGAVTNVTTEYRPEENLADFTNRLKSELDKAFAERVVTEKVSLPNPVVKETNDDKLKLEQVKYYEARGYIKKEFIGGSGSGRSTKGGQHAGENNLKIIKVFELSDREVWFYNKG